jgi:hypothetical protein
MRKEYNFYYTCVKNKSELSVVDFRLINTMILLLAFMSMAGGSLSILHKGSLNLKKCSIISIFWPTILFFFFF